MLVGHTFLLLVFDNLLVVRLGIGRLISVLSIDAVALDGDCHRYSGGIVDQKLP